MSAGLTIALCFGLTVAVLLIDAWSVLRRRDAVRESLRRRPGSPHP